MKRMKYAALLAATCTALPAGAQIVFSEDFDDGLASTRWSAPFFDSEDGVADGTVDYAFDYVALGLPLAPGGGSGTGVFFEANVIDNTGDEGVSLAIIPLAPSLPSGSFRMTMDAYLNIETANGGTTEYGTFGVHAFPANDPLDPGLTDDAPLRFGLSNGSGVAWQIDGDAGSSIDILRYEDANNGDMGAQTSLGAFDDLPSGVIPGLPANATGSNAIGPGNNWVQIAIERIGNNLSFSINGYVIDSIFDGSGAFDGGGIMLGYSDAFNSVASPDYLVGPDPTPFDNTDGPFGDAFPGLAHFLVIDNVVVEAVVPEPTTLALVLPVMAGLAMRRRA
ncbi:hypothetical protein Pla108_26540 [Botrimarina colliarenosi]|uniref:PEP-CTERM protein-sorting domain-containing protein n=1 Tax=Botrimarina colliarenosi TaxID=2528001 RepID=A0A5C6ABC4_9BACT|nr:PEP-CTERM sorting domain-containing protein [Botrimarina colliarenosi]TWT96879.1 hypothetical protein Pla108_26540 [Botrimarina colliarenosi]